MDHQEEPFFVTVADYRRRGKTLRDIATLTGATLSSVKRAYYYARRHGHIKVPPPTPDALVSRLASKGVIRGRGRVKDAVERLSLAQIDALAARAARKSQSLAEALGDLAAEALDEETSCEER